MKKMNNFYDTSSLLLKTDSLFQEEEHIFISSITLKELERIKTAANKDFDIKYQARKLLHIINENIDKISFIVFQEYMLGPIIQKDLEISDDIKILACAYSVKNQLDGFYTNDLSLYTIAQLFFPRNQLFQVETTEDDYTGYKNIIMSEDEMNEFYSNLNNGSYNNKLNLLTNEYLNILDDNGNIVDTYRWNGNLFTKLKYATLESSYLGKTKPFQGDIYQNMVIDSFLNNQITMIKGSAGTGKAQPNSTLIPTKNGYVKLGDIKIGDKVLDREGKETTVLAIYPQGLKENYKITFSDGRIAFCNDEHLWSCYTSKGNLKDFTVREMIDSGLRQKCGDWKYKIPRSQQIQFTEKNFLIDPYVIGVFLGDGCCKESALTLSSADEEIVQEISRLIGAVEYAKGSKFTYNWNFYKKPKTNIKGVPTRFLTRDLFEKYQEYLIQPAYNKAIPEEYKFGSVEQRFSLLQGLMDTDGTIDNPLKGRVRFSSTSIKLIKDIQEICWSLGFSASISVDNRQNKYTHDLCYTLTISCPKNMKHKLFRLKRKKEIALQYENNGKVDGFSNKITIKKIEKMPHLEEMTCILVDNKEHLYLTEQYIVTHNSYLSMSYLFHLLDKDKIDKIIIFCNPVATKNSAKLGLAI